MKIHIFKPWQDKSHINIWLNTVVDSLKITAKKIQKQGL